MSYRIKFLEIIEHIIYLNLATVDEYGSPHNSPVYTAYDENYNFYWKSWSGNVHSKNIDTNERCFITIYDSTVLEGTGIGVYMSGTSKKLEEELEIKLASSLLSGRKGAPARGSTEHIFSYPREIYKFTPEKIWVNGNDTKNKDYVDIRLDITQEILQK